MREIEVQKHTISKMQGRVTISNERQPCEWNKETYFRETHVFFPSHKFEQDN